MFSSINNVKIGVKLIAGFCIVAAIAAVIGIMGITSTGSMNDGTQDMYNRGMRGSNAADAVCASMLEMARGYRNMVIFNTPDVVANYQNQNQASFKKGNEALETLMQVSKAPSTIALINSTREALRAYEAEGDNLRRTVIAHADEITVPENILAALRGLRARADEVDGLTTQLTEWFNSVGKNINEETTAEYKKVTSMLTILLIGGVILGLIIGYLLSNSISKPLSQGVAMLSELQNGHLSARLRMARNDEIGMMAKTLDTFADELQNNVVGTMKKISNGDLTAHVVPHDSQDEIAPALMNTLESLRGLIIDDGGKALHAAAEKDLTARVQREYKGDYAKMKANINQLIENLEDAMSQVGDAVDQVRSASQEISGGAQSLAEGANEQASSLEEVSSSLEEMSSMTKQNADNSTQAKHLVGDANSSINEANEAMVRMAEAIKSIKASSDNTAKIIKTIDDIAFQTNLLALNAAVEAARAGEAGKGFAVVAEEVRNLAMRSAEAAKNTADLIEQSVKNADGGVKITEDVAKALSKSADSASKVGDLIAEIAAASNEQSLGVEQINTAVAQMNQVTQQNAANSEESASAAEELSSQASELSNMVAQFKLSRSGGGGGRPRQIGVKPAGKPTGHTVRMPAISDKRGGGAPSMTKSMKAVKSEEIIPLDDNDLMEF